MTRQINCQVNNEYVIGAGVVAGSALSHDDVLLHLTFNSLWDGLTKKITWVDAYGEASTLTILTQTMLQPDGSYLVPIPYEAKKYPGQMTMSVKGSVSSGSTETRATLSATAEFTILDSTWDDDAEESADVTPSQATQLQEEIDELEDDIQEIIGHIDDSEAWAVGKINGTDVPSTDPRYHNNSKYYSTQASGSATTASTKAGEASASATAASGSATNASNSATAASGSATTASLAKTAAESARDRAEAAETKIENMTATASGLLPGEDPTVTKTETASGFNLAFGIPKGEKGDTGSTGESAGFGTPTATIDANTGTPSVTITSSGPDTAKVFNFEFHNLKGESGSGSGDMLKSDYDSTSAVKNAGGIPAYVEANSIPVGGTTGQALVKRSSTDRDVEWNTIAGNQVAVQTTEPTDPDVLVWYDPSASGYEIDTTPTSGSANLITSGGVYTGLSGKEDSSNKVTSFQETPDNTHYPSEKLVKDSLDTKASTTYVDTALQSKASTSYVDAEDTALDEKIDNGYYNPSAGGKNLLNCTYGGGTLSGVTYTRNNDGSYTLNGTATSGNGVVLCDFEFVNGITYKLVGTPSPNNGAFCYIKDKGSDNGSGLIYNSTETQKIQIGIYCNNGATLNNLVFKPMITEDLSATYNDYEPYIKSNLALTRAENIVNLLNPTLGTTTQNGVTCTNNGDGTYTLNGTATDAVSFDMNFSILTIGTLYKVVGCPNGGSSGTYLLGITDGVDNVAMEYGSGTTYRPTRSNLTVRMLIRSGYTCNNLLFKPMITTNLSATYEDFVEYGHYTQYRGRTRQNITSNLSNLTTAIAEQNLEKYGYSIGDYFVGASGYVYHLADIDTYYGGYNNQAVVNTHHCGIVVDTKSSSQYQSSGSVSSYSASTLHTFLSSTALNNIKSDITALFGSWQSHLLSHTELDNAVGGWGTAWSGLADTLICALSEVQVYGANVWSCDAYQTGTACKPLNLFMKYRHNEIIGNTWWWLRSLVSASVACSVIDNGLAGRNDVTSSGRVVGLILFH